MGLPAWYKNAPVKITSVEDLPDSAMEIAQCIGIDNALELMANMGGITLYLPKAEKVLRQIRDVNACIEYDGYNTRQIAMKYDISESWLRRMVNTMPAATIQKYRGDA